MLRNQKVFYRFQKEPLICPIPKSLKSSRTRLITIHCSSLRFTLILQSHLSASFPSVRFLSDFHRKLLTHFSCFIRVQNRTHIFLLDLFIFIMFSKAYKLCYKYLSHAVQFITCRNDMQLEKLMLYVFIQKHYTHFNVCLLVSSCFMFELVWLNHIHLNNKSGLFSW